MSLMVWANPPGEGRAYFPNVFPDISRMLGRPEKEVSSRRGAPALDYRGPP